MTLTTPPLESHTPPPTRNPQSVTLQVPLTYIRKFKEARQRKYRMETTTASINVTVAVVSAEDAPVVLKRGEIHGYWSAPEQTYRLVNGRLVKLALNTTTYAGKKDKYTPQSVQDAAQSQVKAQTSWHTEEKDAYEAPEDVAQHVSQNLSEEGYVLIEGVLYCNADEPVYLLQAGERYSIAEEGCVVGGEALEKGTRNTQVFRADQFGDFVAALRELPNLSDDQRQSALTRAEELRYDVGHAAGLKYGQARAYTFSTPIELTIRQTVIARNKGEATALAQAELTQLGLSLDPRNKYGQARAYYLNTENTEEHGPWNRPEHAETVALALPGGLSIQVNGQTITTIRGEEKAVTELGAPLLPDENRILAAGCALLVLADGEMPTTLGERLRPLADASQEQRHGMIALLRSNGVALAHRAARGQISAETATQLNDLIHRTLTGGTA